MAHLWIRDELGWGAQRLPDAGFDLAATPGARSRDRGRPAPAGEVARLVRANPEGRAAWTMIASSGADVRVNSRTVPAGLRVLADRDEIRVGNDVLYFSTERLAAIEAFPVAGRVVFCGRCRQQIDPGSPAVCCPSCGIWYNQSPDLPCWTYSDKCTFCGHPTALDAGFAWTPEED
jgi:hypothetical protein